MEFNVMSNLSLKILSLLIAILLWFVVLSSRNIEVTKEVPIEVITPMDLIVANDIPDRVLFRLSGPKAFFRNIFDRKEEPIRINLSTARPGLLTYRFYSDYIQVPLGVKVLSFNPPSVVIQLEELKSKMIPVRLVTMGSPPLGYKIIKIGLKPSIIHIKGAQSHLSQITEVPTMPIDLSQIRESGERPVGIELIHYPGISVEGSLPKLQVAVVQMLAPTNFKVNNIPIKVLTRKHFQVEPPEATLYIRANASALEQMDRSKVYAVVDLRNKNSGDYEVPLSVQLPSNVKLIKVTPLNARVRLW